jgi:8-oxo-dGTP diphosphatase
LVNHKGLTADDFWSFPGGGIQFGETAADCVAREFLEETGLNVQVGEFLFACEFIHKPLHSIELIFSVKELGGSLQLGSDPESGTDQIIKNVAFLNETTLQKMNQSRLHGIFRKTKKIDEIMALRGYFKL